jgi:hypothetical protein
MKINYQFCKIAQILYENKFLPTFGYNTIGTTPFKLNNYNNITSKSSIFPFS